MIKIEIVNGTIVPFTSIDNRKDEGSELIFNGRVRLKENGKEIVALEYEQYVGMAESELNNIAKETIALFLVKEVFCRHRIGKVPVGEASLHIVIWSKHRKEGLNAMTYFITE